MVFVFIFLLAISIWNCQGFPNQQHNPNVELQSASSLAKNRGDEVVEQADFKGDFQSLYQRIRIDNWDAAWILAWLKQNNNQPVVVPQVPWKAGSYIWFVNFPAVVWFQLEKALKKNDRQAVEVHIDLLLYLLQRQAAFYMVYDHALLFPYPTADHYTLEEFWGTLVGKASGIPHTELFYEVLAPKLKAALAKRGQEAPLYYDPGFWGCLQNFEAHTGSKLHVFTWLEKKVKRIPLAHIKLPISTEAAEDSSNGDHTTTQIFERTAKRGIQGRHGKWDVDEVQHFLNTTGDEEVLPFLQGRHEGLLVPLSIVQLTWVYLKKAVEQQNQVMVDKHIKLLAYLAQKKAPKYMVWGAYAYKTHYSLQKLWVDVLKESSRLTNPRFLYDTLLRLLPPLVKQGSFFEDEEQGGLSRLLTLLDDDAATP